MPLAVAIGQHILITAKGPGFLERLLHHNNHHADRFALGTNRDEREQTNGRLSCKIRFEEEVYYNAR